MTGRVPLEVWDLRPGGISDAYSDRDKFFILQVTDWHDLAPPPDYLIRRLIKNDLAEAKRAPLIEALYDAIREREGAVYDSANVRWTAEQFRESMGEKVSSFSVGTPIPDIAPADTSRVLVRTRGGRFTVGQFLSGLHQIPNAVRPKAHTPGLLLSSLDRMFFHPQLVAEARARGLEDDPLVVKGLQRKREEILVQHLYGDSVGSKVWASAEERRAYFEEHRSSFITRPTARFAQIVRWSRAGADSALAALRAGADPESLVAGDRSLGWIREAMDNEAMEYRSVVFGELKEGQGTVLGPDKENKYMVLFVLHHEPSRPMAYDEPAVQAIVDESVYNLKSEQALNAFLERRRRHYRIEAHPEWVMRIELTDPISADD